MKENEKRRSYNFELLRIIAAFIILFNHIYATPTETSVVSDANNFILQIFHVGGKFGAYLFVIISSYFLCKLKKYDVKSKCFSLLMNVLIYGSVMYIVSCFCNGGGNVNNFFHGFLYWFPFAYIILLVSKPYIDRYIDENNALVHIIFGFIYIIMSLLSVYYGNSSFYRIISKEYIMGPVCFTYTYILIKHLYTKQETIFRSCKKSFVAFIVLYLCMIIVFLCLKESFIRDLTSPICLLSALFLFDFFIKMHITSNYIIKWMAKSSFGVYLLQTNYNMKDIWPRFFSYNELMGKRGFVFWVLLSLIFYFLISMIINYFYSKILVHIKQYQGQKYKKIDK